MIAHAGHAGERGRPLPPALKVFVDESGNFDFSASGTRFMVLTAVSTNGCRSLAADIHKDKTEPSVRDVALFYPRILRVLLRQVLDRSGDSASECILVWTDRVAVHRRRKALEKAIKVYLANELEAAVPYRLYHHSSASEPWLQVADYCSWAVYKKWSGNEVRPIREIQPLVRSELDIFAPGDTTYY